MTIFVISNEEGIIADLYTDEPGYPPPPEGAVALSEELGQQLREHGFANKRLIDGQLEDVPPPPPSPQQIIASYSAAGQALLDSVARDWEYNSIGSAVTYISSSVPQFAAEAVALLAWRDAFWLAAGQLKAAIQAGTATLPETQAAFLALMPAAPERPTL